MAARAGLVHARDHVVVVQMLADAFVVKIVSVDERGYGIQAIRPKSLVDLMMARPRSRRAPGCPPPRSPTTAQGAPEAASSDGAYGQLHAWPEEARLFRPPTTSGPQGSTHVAGSGLMTNEHREHYEHHEHQESPPRPDGRPGGRAQATAGASKPEELTHGNGDGERVGHTIGQPGLQPRELTHVSSVKPADGQARTGPAAALGAGRGAAALPGLAGGSPLASRNCASAVAAPRCSRALCGAADAGVPSTWPRLCCLRVRTP